MKLLERGLVDQHSAWSHSQRLAIALALGGLLCCSVLLIGGVDPRVTLGLGFVGLLLHALLHVRQQSCLPRPAAACALLAAFCALQGLPLPFTVLEIIAPANADVWAGSLSPFGEPRPAWASISLAPALSLVAGVKWYVYGMAFWGAVVWSRYEGPAFPLFLVSGVAATCGVVTLVHGLVGAERVFGVYQPSVPLPRWGVGPLINNNNLAGLLDLGALTAIALVFARTGRSRTIAVVLGLACLAMSISTGSRGGVASLVVSTALLLGLALRHPRRRRVVTVMLPATLASGLVATLVLLDPTTRGALVDTDTSKLQLLAWARPMISDYWAWGVGRGAFGSVFHAYASPHRDMVFEYAENFAVQWLTEWGVVVSCALFAGLAAMFLRLLRWGKGYSVRIAIVAGGVAVLGQNLFDLGLEVPGVCVPLAVALGTGWGMGAAAARSSRSRGAWPGFLAACLLLIVAVLQSPLSLRQERTLVYNAYRRAADSGDYAALYDQLRASARRFPAEPYFARIGALAALRQRSRPMPWIQRALQRGLNNGRTHLILADYLALIGSTDQALLEIRWATTLHDDLVGPGVRRALAITRDAERLKKAVPLDHNRGRVLHGLAGGLPSGPRLTFLRDAVSADPTLVAARKSLAVELVAAMTRNACPPDRETCLAEAQRCASMLQADHSVTNRVAGHLASAELLLLQGQSQAAETELAECAKLPGSGQCGVRYVNLAFGSGDSDVAWARARQVLGTGCRARVACGHLASDLARVFEANKDFERSWRLRRRAAEELDTRESWVRAAQSARRAEHLLDEARIKRELSRKYPAETSVKPSPSTVGAEP